MDWIKLLIPLIAVAVWIISHLASNQQQQQRKAAPRMPPPDEEAPPAPRRRASQELERFLEEVRRRKERTVDQPLDEVVVVAEPAPPPRRPEPSRPTPPRRKPESPAQTRRKPDAPPPVRRVGSMSVSEAIPVVTPVAPEREMDGPMAPPPPPVIPTAPQNVFRPEAMVARSAQSPSAKIVCELLKSRQSLGAAFLLREILDEPISKRRRRRQ